MLLQDLYSNRYYSMIYILCYYKILKGFSFNRKFEWQAWYVKQSFKRKKFKFSFLKFFIDGLKNDQDILRGHFNIFSFFCAKQIQCVDNKFSHPTSHPGSYNLGRPLKHPLLILGPRLSRY